MLTRAEQSLPTEGLPTAGCAVMMMRAEQSLPTVGLTPHQPFHFLAFTTFIVLCCATSLFELPGFFCVAFIAFIAFIGLRLAAAVSVAFFAFIGLRLSASAA